MMLLFVGIPALATLSPSAVSSSDVILSFDTWCHLASSGVNPWCPSWCHLLSWYVICCHGMSSALVISWCDILGGVLCQMALLRINPSIND